MRTYCLMLNELVILMIIEINSKLCFFVVSKSVNYLKYLNKNPVILHTSTLFFQL